jgi:hypothetical protein
VRLALTLWLALAPLGLAQGLTAAQVVQWIQGCDTRLYLHTPGMRSREVAEALHRQLTKNGVPLLVASPKEGLFSTDGIGLMGLGWAGARLFRVITPERRGVLLCEGRFGLVGSLVDRPQSPLPAPPTRLLQEPGEVRKLTLWFRRLLGGALEVDPRATWRLMIRR